MSGAGATGRRGLIGWLTRIEDGAVIRAAFLAMLAGTLSVLSIDYRELTEAEVAAPPGPLQPVLPAFDPDSPAPPAVTSDIEALKQPLRIMLGAGGVLSLAGTIDRGAAQRFDAELAARGEYVRTVAFDSPGGSVEDAMAIGERIAARGYATSVAAGALCASSCPLAFAGGRTRHASPASVIGVHQVYAALEAGALPSGVGAAGDAMSDAQRTTAAITRYLVRMGVDPALWLHALETPPDRLYYLTPEELTAYRLVTALAAGGG